MSNHDCFDGDRAIGWEGRSSLRRAGRMDTLSQCIASSRDHLLRRPEGFWVGELEADSSLESDAILPDYFFWQPPVGPGGYTRRLYPGRADAGRRMTSLPRRLSQYQSHSQSVLGLAAGGCCGIQSGPAKGSRCDPPVGRRGIEEKETMRMQPCFFRFGIQRRLRSLLRKAASVRTMLPSWRGCPFAPSSPSGMARNRVFPLTLSVVGESMKGYLTGSWCGRECRAWMS